MNPVFLWYPNLVGYARVLFMVAAFYLCFDRPFPAALCYVISQGLDAVDGQVARHFKQCSKFGAVLDMLTDRSVDPRSVELRLGLGLGAQSRGRGGGGGGSETSSTHLMLFVVLLFLCPSLLPSMSTAVLLIVLALQYQKMWGFFAFLVVLDIVSHWYQMYSKLMQNAQTHKGSKNPLLNFYYVEVMSFWPRLPWLLIFCVGNEMFLVCLYMLSFSAAGTMAYQVYYLLAVVSFPIFSAKQFFNVIQLADSASEIAAVDYEQHLKQ